MTEERKREREEQEAWIREHGVTVCPPSTPFVVWWDRKGTSFSKRHDPFNSMGEADVMEMEPLPSFGPRNLRFEAWRKV